MDGVNRVIRCDCGFEAVGAEDDDIVSRAQAHAQEAHQATVSAEFLLSLAGPRRPGPPQA